jgi:hypothetical protein
MYLQRPQPPSNSQFEPTHLQSEFYCCCEEEDYLPGQQGHLLPLLLVVMAQVSLNLMQQMTVFRSLLSLAAAP